MNSEHIPLFDETGVDMIQIGARNMQNFELLKAVGRTNIPVLLKRGLSATLEELVMSAEYIICLLYTSFAEVRHGKWNKTRHLQDPPIKFIDGCARQKNGQRAHEVKTKYILLHYTLFYLLRQEKLAAARGRCYNKPYFAQSTRSVGKGEGI